MKKITVMNRQNAKIIDEAIVSKLKEIEEMYGVKITSSGGRFTDSSLDLKLSVNVESKIKSGFNSNEMKYINNLTAYDVAGGFDGIKSDKIGKIVDWNSKEMILIGLTSTRSNAKFVVRCKSNNNLYTIANESRFTNLFKS